MTDDIRQATVRVLLALRDAYLATGANPITHWTQIHDRMRAAARTTTSAAEWATKLQRDLRITEIPPRVATALVELARAVGENDRGFLRLISDEHAYLVALARHEADSRKRKRTDGNPQD